jgi:hypothetical protein
MNDASHTAFHAEDPSFRNPDDAAFGLTNFSWTFCGTSVSVLTAWIVATDLLTLSTAAVVFSRGGSALF